MPTPALKAKYFVKYTVGIVCCLFIVSVVASGGISAALLHATANLAVSSLASTVETAAAASKEASVRKIAEL